MGSQGNSSPGPRFGLPASPIPIDDKFAFMTQKPRFPPNYLRVAAAFLLLAALAALFVAGAQPFAVNLIPSPWDKIAHVMAFATLAATVGLAVGLQNLNVVPIAIAATLSIGALDELHQMLIAGRNAGWDDFVADALGASAGAILLILMRRRPDKHNSND